MATVRTALIALDAALSELEQANAPVCAQKGHDWVTQEEMPDLPTRIKRMCWRCGAMVWHKPK